VSPSPFLFSVDVEDPHLDAAGRGSSPPRVPALVEAYLSLLRSHGGSGTFFFVGRVARRHPELVARVIAEGHEAGCHSDAHIPLDRQDAATFRDDVRRNRDAVRTAGAREVNGYRAPCFSMTERTAHCYAILAELGFSYSSSVLPARRPLCGWPGFGKQPKLVDGILEMPVTLLPSRLFPVPLGGGYFRLLPRPLLRRALVRLQRQGQPVLSYCHPYDIDPTDGRTHPAFARWSAKGVALRTNRAAVLPRLEAAARLGFRFEAYGPHAAAVRSALALDGG
jgi:polysaccharide deacetylase family protein (PEP-CTERM system associated)